MPEPTMALAMPPPVSPTGVGSLVKKFQLTSSPAVIDQIAQNKKEHRDGDQRAQPRQAEHQHVHDLSPSQLHPCATPLPRLRRNHDQRAGPSH